jgi:hypothetical protein
VLNLDSGNLNDSFKRKESRRKLRELR